LDPARLGGGLLALPVLALAAVAAGRPEAVRRALPGILAGIFLAADYGLLQRAGIDPLGLRPGPEVAPVAPFAGTNHAAEALLPALVAAVALPAAGVSGRLLRLAALPAALAGGWFGVTAFRLGLPLGLAWTVRRERARLLPACLILAAFLGGEALRAAGVGTLPTPETTDSEAAAGPSTDADWTSWTVRWLTHRDGLAHAAVNPLGIGLGRFEVDYPLWRSPETLRAASHDYRVPETPVHKDPHDELLLLLLECGWLGAGLILAGAARAGREAPRPVPAEAAGALLALAVPLLVRAPLSDNPPALALAAILTGLALAGAEPARRPAGGRWTPLALALTAAAAAPAQIGGELAVADHFRRGGAEPLERAVALRPWDSRAWDLLAVERGRAGDLDGVRQAFTAALAADPGDLFALDGLFTAEQTAGRYPEALAALARMEAVAPDHPAVRSKREWIEHGLVEQARERIETGDWAGARAALERAEGLGDPAAPTVRAARTALFRAWAEDHRRAAGAIVREAAEAPEFDPAEAGRLRQHFLLAHLFTALAAVRDGDLPACREALRAAQTYADALAPVVARLARRRSPGEAEVRALLLRLDPGLAEWLGPEPAAD
ncbi:MAG: hypothetical protein D6702_02200, partial [Planctomycetota bacterium]